MGKVEDKKYIQKLINEITEEAKKVVEDYTKYGTELSGSITQVHYDSPILNKKKLDKDKNN
tara:strand:- start:701 stop:883 length:183 start_codon:yes stop_codon:yes gene_type:complete